MTKLNPAIQSCYQLCPLFEVVLVIKFLLTFQVFVLDKNISSTCLKSKHIHHNTAFQSKNSERSGLAVFSF